MAEHRQREATELGTMLTATTAVQLTTEVEHVAPETAVRLEAGSG